MVIGPSLGEEPFGAHETLLFVGVVAPDDEVRIVAVENLGERSESLEECSLEGAISNCLEVTENRRDLLVVTYMVIVRSILVISTDGWIGAADRHSDWYSSDRHNRHPNNQSVGLPTRTRIKLCPVIPLSRNWRRHPG